LDYLAFIQTFGWPIGTLLIAVVMLYTDMVVSGKRYRDACAQRDRLLKLALGGQRKAWQAADLADALVQPREGDPHEGD